MTTIRSRPEPGLTRWRPEPGLTRWRPEPGLIRAQWRQLISNPSISFHQLKKTALSGNLSILRSLYWRIFLGQLPTPSIHLKPSSPNLWTSKLDSYRRDWDTLKSIHLRAPDGLWLQDSSQHSSPSNPLQSNYPHPTLAPITPHQSPPQDLGVNNPLSQHEANPWKAWLNDLELRKIIQQDVIRTFPDLDYFRQPRTQVMLTNILHVYSKIHHEIGYRQGMHELLGVLLETLDLDSLELPTDGEPELIHQVLSRDFLEHDAFNLFCLLMRPMKDCYDCNLVVPLLEIANHQTTPLTSVGFIPSQLDALHHPIQPDPCSRDSFVHPIVDKCATIFHVYLKQIDPCLWAHLAKLEIEPQLWGIRWLRLLFTREFSYQESLLIWDGILAEDGVGLRLADFMCIAMLLRIRQSLLEADYSNALQLILRFPKPDDGNSRIDLLLYQALLLSRLPTPTTASLINRQNLDQRLFSHSSSSPAESDSSWFGSRRQTLSSSPAANPRSPLTSRYPMQTTSNEVKPIDDKLRSPMMVMGAKKSQSLGKSKSFLSAFADLRKSYSPTALPENHGMASSPPISKLSASSHSMKTRQPQGQTDCLANQQVGQALGLCVDALEQNILNFPQIANSGHGLALGVLKHIRDVMLSGFSSGFDSNVMSPLIDYQSDTHQNHSPQDHHPPPSSQPSDPSSSQSRNTLALDRSSNLSESPPLLRNSSFSGEGPESVELSMTRVESSSLRSPLKLSSVSTSPSSLESIDSITQHSSSSSSGSSSTGTQSSQSRTILERRKGEVIDGIRLPGTIDRERGDEDDGDQERRPARVVQKLSPSIFGTKLWMESRSSGAPQSNRSLKKQRDHPKSTTHDFSNLHHEEEQEDDDGHPPLPLHLYHSPPNPSDPASKDGSTTPAQPQFESLILVERRPIFL